MVKLWPQSGLTSYLIFVGTKDPFRHVVTCSCIQKPRILLKENAHALEEERERERLGEKWLFSDMEGNLGRVGKPLYFVQLKKV